MPLLLDDMTEPDRPVTRRELREELEAVLRTLATKDDLKAFATKEDLKAFATKEDLKAFATKEDLKAFATKEDFRELRAHFDAVAEHFKSEFFDKLHDWTHGNVEALSARVTTIENDHSQRLFALETRVSALEAKRPRNK